MAERVARLGPHAERERDLLQPESPFGAVNGTLGRVWDHRHVVIALLANSRAIDSLGPVARADEGPGEIDPPTRAILAKNAAAPAAMMLSGGEKAFGDGCLEVSPAPVSLTLQYLAVHFPPRIVREAGDILHGLLDACEAVPAEGPHESIGLDDLAAHREAICVCAPTMTVDPQFVRGVGIRNPLHERLELRMRLAVRQSLDRDDTRHVANAAQLIADRAIRFEPEKSPLRVRHLRTGEQPSVAFRFHRRPEARLNTLVLGFAIALLAIDVFHEVIEVFPATMREVLLGVLESPVALDGARAEMEVEIPV